MAEPSDTFDLVPSRQAELALGATLVSGGEGAELGVHAELEPGMQIGRYLLLSRLGAGGMGVVYAAYDPELDRKLALELLRSEGGDAGAARVRLQREAQSLARLDHPNVVRVHDSLGFAWRSTRASTASIPAELRVDALPRNASGKVLKRVLRAGF